ncbi:MAG: hypothetical protein F6K19_21755 [Cyanothece sp. SIO1E1]|nr:hypothetical protein [Cyanothece sp. SIO1E1]
MLINILFIVVVVSTIYFGFIFFRAIQFLREKPKPDFDKKNRFEVIEKLLEQIKNSNSKSVFEKRIQHHVEEKRALAKTFVEEEIPHYLKYISKPFEKLPTINIVISSGVTLSVVFKYLVENRSLFLNYPVKFYSNNIFAFQRYIRQNKDYPGILHSFPMTILPGNIDPSYGGTYGNEAVDSLLSLREEANKNNDLILGLSSPSWVLVGKNYDNIQICSTSSGLSEVENTLLQISDVVYIIKPITNVLATDNISILNEINPMLSAVGGFNSYSIPKKKVLPVLFTTRRVKDSNSNLILHSKRLFDANVDRNFELSLATLAYNPASKEEEFSKEESYVLARGYEFFGIPKIA